MLRSLVAAAAVAVASAQLAQTAGVRIDHSDVGVVSGRTYLYYPNSDVMSTSETIFPESGLKNVTLLMALCDATPECVGFNTNGWLKNGTTSLGPNPVDVYLVAPSPAPSPPALVWPEPQSLVQGSTPLVVSSQLTFTATNPSPDLDAAFARFTALFFPHGQYPTTQESAAAARFSRSVMSALTVTVTNTSVPLQLGVDESYTLTLQADGTAGTLTAATVYGAYHGLQTLSQLLSFDFDAKAYWVAAPLTVTDAPKFSWRGLMIDPARRFLPLRTIFDILDSMTYAKLNALHVHIVDCDSWPLEVPGTYSQLWQGAFSPRERYTTQDLTTMVEYGRQRGVRVIFEFDSPGHAGSMCDAYPQLCPAPTCREPLNPASSDTLPALKAVISTLASASMDTVLHLGGDEVDPTCWNNSAAVRAWMAANGISSLDGIYEYFVEQTNAMAEQLNMSPMRWEEVWKHFRTQLDRRTIIEAWLSTEAMNDAANNGYRTVFSVDDSYYYLDYLDVTWDQTYSTDILASVTNASAVPFILGGEMCMWGETVDAGTVLQTIWPRAAAGAERLWSYNFRTTNATAQSWQVITRFAQFRCLMLERGIPAASPGNTQAGQMGPAWTVGSCGGGYHALC